MLEVKFATAGQAEPEALDLYSRTSGNLRRLLEAVGLERRARVVNQSSDQAELERLLSGVDYTDIDDEPDDTPIQDDDTSEASPT